MKYLKKFKTLFKAIFNLLRHDYDSYVPYYWRKNSLFEIIKLENLNFIRRARIKYWHNKAANYSPFTAFFNADELKKVELDESLPLDVRNIYKFGTAVVSNVLSEDEISLINNFANGLTLKSDSNYVQTILPSSLNEVRSKLLQKLQPIHMHFFPKPFAERKFSKIYVGLRVDFSFDGSDSSPQTANWHVDRFLPSINALYFPNGAKWGEFEKDFGSPLITNKDIEYYIHDKKKNKKTPEEIRDNLYVTFHGRIKKKFTVENDTMYIGTHHMQHRRSPISTPGKRVAIFIDHYDFFTRKDLLY